MSISKKTCFLFTQTYPYGDGEVFVEQEVPFLANYFKKVVIFPLDNKGELRNVPSNVEVRYLFSEMNNEYRPTVELKKNLLSFIKVIGSEFFSNPFHTIKKIKQLSSGLLQQFYRATQLNKEIQKEDKSEIVFYSYWFDSWITILGILKFQKKLSIFTSRAHAFDIYEEDNINGIIPFRKFQLEQITSVYAVSNHGKDYLRQKYKNFANKINKAWLGKAIHEEINPYSKLSLRIVSCGSVQNRKRVAKIPEILRHLKVDFKWTHFGDGDEMVQLKEKIKEYKLDNNVTLKGHVNNIDFLNHLKHESVSFFLSISRNEGLPFTIIEAISFGIPIIATDAMGCRDIVSYQTGILIPVNFVAEKVAKQMEDFYYSEMNSIEFRKGVKDFWKQNFEAENNYFEFYKLIK